MQLVLRICSLLLITSLIYFHYFHPHIKTPINVIFGRMLVFLDIVVCSSICLQLFPADLNIIELIMYKCLFVIRSSFLVIFICYVFNYIVNSCNATKYIIKLPLQCLFVLTAISLAGLLNGYYESQYLVSLASIFVVIAVVIMVNHVDEIGISKLKALVLWFVFWFTAAAVQGVFYIDFSSFVCALGLFFLFYASENPDGKIDKSSGFFLSHYVKEYFDANDDSDLSIAILHSRNSQIDVQTVRSLIYKKNISPFIDINNYCYLVSTDSQMLQQVLLDYNSVYTSVLIMSEHITGRDVNSILSYAKRQSESIGEGFIYFVHLDDIQKLDKDDKMHLEIINALVENRIETYIQPIYEIKSDSFVSGECLCRLRRRNGDLVSPGEFIGVAERTGLIVDIETSMFRNMCQCLSDDRIKNSSIKYLEANLSIKKGEQRNLFEEYTSIVNEYGINFDKVNLEITETDSVDKKLSILNNMKVMRELGFNFSLDDFGTGESNLGYIIDMPVSIIKFDKEITQKAMINDRALLVVKNVIQMVHDMNIKVVVEGVETFDDLAMCKKLNADYIQGYYFSKPLPMSQFIEFIMNASKNGSVTN